jgi:hypothetical protein
MLLPASSYAMQQALVVRDSQGYNVVRDGQCCAVKPYDTDSLLRMMSPSQLKSFIDAGGSIRIHQLSNGDYMLRSYVPGKGGGGLLGALVVIGGTVATGLVTVAATAGGFVVGGPAGAAAAAVVVSKAGLAATVYGAIVATATPTP